MRMILGIRRTLKGTSMIRSAPANLTSTTIITDRLVLEVGLLLATQMV
ncbi:hypothetical protein [Haloferula sp.]